MRLWVIMFAMVKEEFRCSTMPVDDYKVAIALTEKIKEYLPVTVRPTKELSKLLKKQGVDLANQQAMVVDDVFYMGDEGGISCSIESEESSDKAHIVSITHLVIDPDHPLAPEIQSYQRQRIRALKLQNSRSFMAEMNRLSSSAPDAKKKRGDRGFGK